MSQTRPRTSRLVQPTTQSRTPHPPTHLELLCSHALQRPQQLLAAVQLRAQHLLPLRQLCEYVSVLTQRSLRLCARAVVAASAR